MAANDDDRVRSQRDNEFDYPTHGSRRRDDYDEEDAEDVRAIRRRDEGDATGGLIPYKNATALASYYCGVFGLISCILLLGVFGIVPIILGILGLKHARQHPQARGQAHAVVGIILGTIEVLTFLAQVGFIIATVAGK